MIANVRGKAPCLFLCYMGLSIPVGTIFLKRLGKLGLAQ